MSNSGRCRIRSVERQTAQIQIAEIRPAARPPLLQRHNIHTGIQRMPSPAQQNPMHRAHIAVISPPRHRNMPIRGHTIIRRIETHPTRPRAPGRAPRMRSIRPNQSGPSGRRQGPQIPAHIPRRQPHRTHTSNLPMREVLTHTRRFSKNVSTGVLTSVAFVSNRKSRKIRCVKSKAASSTGLPAGKNSRAYFASSGLAATRVESNTNR